VILFLHVHAFILNNMILYEKKISILIVIADLRVIYTNNTILFKYN